MEIFATLMGVTFRGSGAREIVKHLTVNDGELLSLKTEPTNEYDNHAVQVIYEPTGEHIGYISRENNYEVFLALEDGVKPAIKIVGFENTLKPTLLIQWEESALPKASDGSTDGSFEQYEQ